MEKVYNEKDYGGFDNFLLLEYLKPKQKVLDVGCSKGELGFLIKKKFGSCVCGIEVSGKSAEIAEKYLDKVIIADIEKEFNLTEESFDVIIFADILEHLYDPINCLKKFKNYLNEKGYFLISIPNVANWLIRWKLLFGNFDYEPAGIMDETHIRFFTFKSIKKMLREVGLEIKELNTTYNINIPLLSRVSAFRAFISFVTRLNKNLLARQFIIVAKNK